MTIQALGYVVAGSDRLSERDGFATRRRGMQRVDRAGGVRAFRMDDRGQRLIVSDAEAAAHREAEGFLREMGLAR